MSGAGRPGGRELLALAWHRLRGAFVQRSYAQEGEDLILRRLFEGRRRGRYVDVGAHHPERFSNTCIFYHSGWSGINIDATPGSMALFRALRPRDVNLELAIGAPGPARSFFVFDEPALNTFDPEHARLCQAHGYSVVAEVPVPIRALADVLAAHLGPQDQIDFLSVDVEGLDLEVLASNDWGRFRPACVLVETLNRDLEAVAAGATAHFLRDQGYRLFAKTVNTSFFMRQ